MFKSKSLISQNKKIILDKATEYPGTGRYNQFDQDGTYLCRNCGIALFRSDSKFHSSCGWPSFDAQIANNVKLEPDVDGIRTEIVCVRCDGHLGHVFYGEGFTPLNTRYCVNSASLDFVDNQQVLDSEEVILAAGCFWGVQYYLNKLSGVLKTEVGYSGGHLDNPSYKEVCAGKTGHLEVIRVLFDPSIISLKELIKYFFEIHDPTQINGQGPDIGEQYLSAIFYYDETQLNIINMVIQELVSLKYNVVTKIMPVSAFWIAEDYHQNYYMKNGNSPYCHSWQKKF